MVWNFNCYEIRSNIKINFFANTLPIGQDKYEFNASRTSATLGTVVLLFIEVRYGFFVRELCIATSCSCYLYVELSPPLQKLIGKMNSSVLLRIQEVPSSATILTHDSVTKGKCHVRKEVKFRVDDSICFALPVLLFFLVSLSFYFFFLSLSLFELAHSFQLSVHNPPI